VTPLAVFWRAAWSRPSTAIIRYRRLDIASLLQWQGCRRSCIHRWRWFTDLHARSYRLWTSAVHTDFISWRRRVGEEVARKQRTSDSLPTWLLKRSAEVLGPFLCRLILRERYCPVDVQVSLHYAVIEEGKADPADTKSYRPISNLSVISKMLERLRYLKDNDPWDIFNRRTEAYRTAVSVSRRQFLRSGRTYCRHLDSGMYVCMYVYSFKTVDKSQHRQYRQ